VRFRPIPNDGKLGRFVVDGPTVCGHSKHNFSLRPREYGLAPFWVWNDMLTDEQVKSSLNDLARQNVKAGNRAIRVQV